MLDTRVTPSHMALSSEGFHLAEDGTAIIKGPMGAVGVQKLASFTAVVGHQHHQDEDDGVDQHTVVGDIELPQQLGQDVQHRPWSAATWASTSAASPP